MARADRVSPFFTSTRVLRGLDATVFDLVLWVANVAELFGFVPLDDTFVALPDLIVWADMAVVGLTRDTFPELVEVELVIGVMLAGGLSFAASNVASSASGEESFEKDRRVHLDGLSAHAST